MAKTKNKKPGKSDNVRKKKHQTEKEINPFEIKFNRSKHDVLGRKVEKHHKGMPGVSRSKAIKKRKETLLVEYKAKKKANKFVDKRIGEDDPELSVEDKMLKRFAKERLKHVDKSNKFSLNDSEELTHYGQSLAEIEKFDEPNISDDDDDDHGPPGTSAYDKIVGSEHFGGFLTKKEGSGDKPETKHKTWKERMEEIIATSKKEKHERQSEREKTIEMTKKVDTDLKELRSLMGGTKKTKKDKDEKVEMDDYDKTVQELRFESKAMATDRLKSEEEQAKEEKERLDKLETERLHRMRGLTDEEQKYANAIYRSADDLDDGLMIGDSSKFEVTYKDGKMVGAEEESGPEAEGSEDDDQDGSEEEGGSGDDNEEEEKEDDEGDDDSDSDAMEHMSDLDSDDSADDDEQEEVEEEKPGKSKKPAEKVDKSATKESKKKVAFAEEVTVGPKDFKQLLKSRKTVMEAARKELPYTFTAPETYVDLLNIFGDHSETEQLTILERLRKCYHPSLGEGNKAKLETLFTLLVEYFGDLVVQDPPCLDLANRLVKHLYELCQMSPLPAGLHMVSLFKDKQDYLTRYAQAHGGRGVFPTLDTLLHLKLVSQLFPTSDFHHHVATPAMLYMSQCLSQCPINTRRDIASGLFICSLFYEYTSFSKRFVPEVLNFLCGILFLAIKKSPKKIEPVIPPFKPVGRNINFLELQKPADASKITPKPVKLSDAFSRKQAKYLSTDEFRINSIWQCVKLLQGFNKLYTELPSYREIFKPVRYFLDKLPVDQYPEQLKEAITDLCAATCIQDDNVRPRLIMLSHRPKPMMMFEPKFDDKFDGRRKRGESKEFNEKMKMQHKYKKEMRGAQREIRKDAQFLARQKLREKMELNQERKRKVKQIYSQLANQEGDYKRLKREKDKL